MLHDTDAVKLMLTLVGVWDSVFQEISRISWGWTNTLQSTGSAAQLLDGPLR